MDISIVSNSSNSVMTSVTMSRPALSWCSKCGQSMEISSNSIMLKSKTNFKFRKIFDFDNSEVLIKTFSCALVDDILLQGTLYTSQNHFCFFSRIANKHKKIIIDISQIVEITKEKTAGIFPNAIAIKTQNNRHLFASFVHREVAFRCLNEVWAAYQTEKFTENWATNENLLDHIHRNMACTKNDDSPDSSNQMKKISRSKDLLRKLNKTSKSFSDTKKEPTEPFLKLPMGNAFDLISKDHIALIIGVIILVCLVLYIVVLAWKIHNLQLVFLQQVINPKSIIEIDKSHPEDILCPTADDHCKMYIESVQLHQTKMLKVQSDLRETLTLLQTVVKLSGKMFKIIQSPTWSGIIASHRNPGET